MFFSGTQDYYLRALGITTGQELWRAPLSVGSRATPMSHVGPSRRQYAVFAVGGLTDAQGRGDDVTAFALPQTAALAAPKG